MGPEPSRAQRGISIRKRMGLRISVVRHFVKMRPQPCRTPVGVNKFSGLGAIHAFHPAVYTFNPQLPFAGMCACCAPGEANEL